jgi:hypothetical protein
LYVERSPLELALADHLSYGGVGHQPGADIAIGGPPAGDGDDAPGVDKKR